MKLQKKKKYIIKGIHIFARSKYLRVGFSSSKISINQAKRFSISENCLSMLEHRYWVHNNPDSECYRYIRKKRHNIKRYHSIIFAPIFKF